MGYLLALFLVMLTLFGFSVIRNVARACSLPANFSPLNSTRPSTFRSVAWSWYAPTAVAALFIAFSGVTNREFVRIFSDRTPAVMATPPVVKESPSQLNEIDPQAGERQEAGPLQEQTAPDWIHAGDRWNGDVRQVVLSSKLWSTAAEATQELQPIAAALVRADFQERHKNLLDQPSIRSLTDEQILHSAVKKRYVEPINQDFGAFSAPMYRLWLEVEISPVVRTELYPAWKSGMVGNRIIALGALLAILTLAANSVALFARLIHRSPHHWSWAATIVATSSTAWIAVGLLLVTRLF